MYSLYELICAACIFAACTAVVLYVFCLSGKRRLKTKLSGNIVKTLGEGIELKELLDNLASGVFIRELKSNKYLYFSREARKLCGDYDATTAEGAEKIVNMTDVSFDIIEKEDDNILRTGTSLKHERIIHNEEGEPFKWIQINKCLIRSFDGKPLILGTIMDITNRNLKKIELENIKMELQMALDAGGIEAWVYHNEDGSVTEFNMGKESAGRRLFYEKDKELLSENDYIELRSGFNSIINGEADLFKLVFKMNIRDTPDFTYYECRMRGVYSKQTGNLNFIIGVQKNITRDVLWQKDLESSRIKTNLAIKTAGMILWEYDINLDKFYSSDPQSIAYSPVTLEDYFLMVHEDDIDAVRKVFSDIIADEGDNNIIEMRILMQDGEYRWVHVQGCVSERDETGKPVKVIGLRRDVDNEKKLTRQLLELKEEAERANKLKSAYLANMSHEIRTPLNAIVGFSNLMMYMDDPEEKEEYNRIIQTNNELLLQLINDILDLSKIEAGFLEFNYEDEDISDIFRQIEQSFVSKIKPGVALKVNIPYEKCIINTDRNRFIQIVSNFLTNACKFTDKGYIEFGYKKTDKGITVYVSDTGIGMTKEQCERVFDRFAKFGNETVGTGLGTSICETLVKMMGGSIGVNSAYGEGSTFWAEIPCEPVIYQTGRIGGKLKGADSPGKTAGSHHERYKYDVLIAEDNDSNYLLASKILEKECNLRRAHDGAECVEMFIANKPDIIFMDIQMPVMDGYEATASIREVDKNIPVIAVTANAFDLDRIKARDAGCNDYITKPVTRDVLLSALKKWC